MNLKCFREYLKLMQLISAILNSQGQTGFPLPGLLQEARFYLTSLIMI
jgi:hypothetical protein